MRKPVGIVLVLGALGLAACATQPRWSERLDVTVTGRGLMVCVIDASGAAECHHRDGVLRSTLSGHGIATCPGAEQHLAPTCDGSESCVIRDVGVPADAFGVLVLEVNRPLFGVPRHEVADALIVARSTEGPSATERGRITEAARAHARCLAPADTQRLHGDAVPVVARSECEARACALRRVSLKLAWQRSVRATGL